MRPIARGLLTLLLMLAVVTTAAAQGTGVVTGTITDETGGVLPGVSITLTPAGANGPLETVTDGVGVYRFDNAPAGPAELSFRLINFSAVRRNLTVTPGTPITANAVMLVASS